MDTSSVCPSHNCESAELQNIAIVPTQIDFEHVRIERQADNHRKIVASIMLKCELPMEYINTVALNQVLEETQKTQEQLIADCRENNTMATLFARNISKKTSRQGTRDEQLQMTVCNDTTSKCGIFIENLDVRAYRPTKHGEILTQDQLVSRNIPKDERLKSFDGKISGKINGFMFAKVVYGSGGHQDSVFEEADTMCAWIKQFRNPEKDEVFVILIDTNLTKKMTILQTKYAGVDGLIIMNHVQFQQYIISKYSNLLRNSFVVSP